MTRNMAKIRFQWVPSDRGGRKYPFIGGLYTPTARFAAEAEIFSVAIRFSLSKQPNPMEGFLGVINTDLVEIQSRIRPGEELEIMEGSRVVGYCTVVSVPEEMVDPLRC